MSYKVLIIDDDEEISRLLTRYFNDKGVWVTAARDGEEGFRLFHKLAPDVVLLDLMLPRVGGEQVLTLIRSHPARGKTPVVVMSASLTRSEQETALITRLKADGAFRKPLLLKELLAKVDELVGFAAPVKRVPGTTLTPIAVPSMAASSAAPRGTPAPWAPWAAPPVVAAPPTVKSTPAPASMVPPSVRSTPAPASFVPSPVNVSATPAPATNARSMPPSNRSMTRGAPVTDPPPVPLNGAASLITLSKLLVHAFENRMEGVLEVKAPHVVRRMSFSDGLIVNVTTSLMGESLGAQLVNERVITEDQARLVRATMNKRSMRFAEAVLLLGVPSPQLLVAAERQTRVLAARALCTPESTYGFKPWTTSPTLGSSYQLDPLEAVQRACLQGLSGPRIKAVLDELPAGNLLRSDAFNERLFLFTRLRPQSSVPVSLMDWPRLSEARQRVEAGGDTAATELLALVLSQAVVLGDPDRVSLRARRAGVLAGDGLAWSAPGISGRDQRLREDIASDWINTAGRNAYEVLGVTPNATDEEIRSAHAHLMERLGPAAMDGVDLGPATPYLVILRNRRDEAARILNDGQARRAYDVALEQERAAAAGTAARWKDFTSGSESEVPVV